MGINEKEYLGDSVYARFDGYGIILTTENGVPGDPSNEIYLEPSVLGSLNQFVGRISSADNQTGND